MTQNEALSILKTGANVFLTGEPGAGKTYAINQFVSYLRERGIEPAITASTGIAATHIGGMTIHSWSGIGIKETLTKYDLDKIGSNEYIVKRINKTRVLIIDEVSMLQAETLKMIDAVCRETRQSSEPFGGMQVILVGDFFQLPPIEKRQNTENKQIELMQREKARFAFESESWVRLSPIICYLTEEQHRQDDANFLSILSAIRRGTVGDSHLKDIHSRQIFSGKFPKDITKLFSHNGDVDRMNTEMLGNIEGEIKEYVMTSSGKEFLVSSLKKGCLSPETLILKKGAIVMCTKNNPKEKFVNGTLGKVEDLEPFSNYPIIRTRSGRIIKVKPMDWTVEENGKIKAKISQVPLRLAWAITIHKSQGMSMDAAVMDLSEVFEFGQGYVALSRVRRLSSLYLLGINDRALKVHPDILKKDISFREESEKVREVFAKIPVQEGEKMRKNFIIALGGKWKNEKNSGAELLNEPKMKKEPGKLEQIRLKYKNAYRPWEKEEDEKLREDFEKGVSQAKLSEIFGRQRGGIRARLIKLGLIEE